MTLGQPSTRAEVKERIRLAGQSSMLHWWPQIRELPIPQPATYCIKVDRKAMYQVLEEGGMLPPHLLPEAQRHCDNAGYPVFIRTDQLSGKHGWKDTCYVERRDDLSRHIYALVEETAMADMMQDISFGALFVRNFLKLKTAFRAFYGNMPINREVRCFVRDGKLECRHPYWFEKVFEQEEVRAKDTNDHVARLREAGIGSAFREGESGLPADWRDQLKELNTLTADDDQTIQEYAGLVGKQFPGEYWSVDFAQGENGTWYLIDMARGELSWHVTPCPHARGESP